jgi:glycosyltransferase involved in cell wall biosynthesis
MKRICIVRHNYYPEEAHVRRDAETLLRHGYEVDIVCLRKEGQGSHEAIRGVNVYRIPIEHHRKGILRYIFEYSAFFLLSSWRLSWLSLRRRYQVVEVVSMPEFLIFATLFPKLLGAKVVLYVYDHTPETFSDNFDVGPNHVAVRLLRAVSRVSLGLADHVIAAEFRSQEIIESRGVSSSKVSLVLNVPDEDVFGCRSFCSNSQGRFCLITHGSLLERYGVQTLIRAVPLLTGNIPELEVKVVGDGEYRPKLEYLAQSLGVRDYVDFTGLVPFEEMPSLIARADVGIVPTIVPMLPNKLFEYLASGKPAVVASSPSIEACFDDGSVMLYEPDDEQDLARCILELYRNPDKRADLAVSGSAIYQKYRWATMKYEYLKVFDQLTETES